MYCQILLTYFPILVLHFSIRYIVTTKVCFIKYGHGFVLNFFPSENVCVVCFELLFSIVFLSVLAEGHWSHPISSGGSFFLIFWVSLLTSYSIFNHIFVFYIFQALSSWNIVHNKSICWIYLMKLRHAH